MSWLGIDPGLDGALALLGEDGEVLAVELMPVIGAKGSKRELDERGLLRVLRALRIERVPELAIDLAVIEHAQALPRQSAVAGFRQGATWGATRMALSALGIRHEVARPQDWRRGVGLSSAGSGTKGAVQRQRKADSIALAQRLFPGVDLRASERCRVPHDGKAEALLLAEYARRRHQGAA